MSRKVPSKSERYFATGLSMITSRGPDGPNIMTAEWVIQISYKPVLIGVFIHEGSQTIKNIEKTKEFGINVDSQEQTIEVSIAGGYSGIEIDKLKIKNIFKTIKPRKIKVPLIAGCIINAECKLVMKKKIGDHFMLIGKVIDIRHNESQSPLIYHRGRYFSLNHVIEPKRNVVKVSKNMVHFFKNLSQGRFVLKCVGVIVESKNKILVQQRPENMLETIPFTNSPAGKNQKEYIIKVLKQSGLDLQTDSIPTLKRLILKNGQDVQRINFVLFRGKIKKSTKGAVWKSTKSDTLISALV